MVSTSRLKLMLECHVQLSDNNTKKIIFFRTAGLFLDNFCFPRLLIIYTHCYIALSLKYLVNRIDEDSDVVDVVLIIEFDFGISNLFNFRIWID